MLEGLNPAVFSIFVLVALQRPGGHWRQMEVAADAMGEEAQHGAGLREISASEGTLP